MKIYTGYFAQVKLYVSKDLNCISIARSCRYFSGVALKSLAPGWDLIHEPEHIYTPRYHAEILQKLNPKSIYEEIKKLSQGKDVILLCHEKTGKFCHRHLVANWLNKNLKIEVKEFEINIPKSNIQKKLF